VSAVVARHRCTGGRVVECDAVEWQGLVLLGWQDAYDGKGSGWELRLCGVCGTSLSPLAAAGEDGDDG
jgi:hypothetical protein